MDNKKEVVEVAEVVEAEYMGTLAEIKQSAEIVQYLPSALTKLKKMFSELNDILNTEIVATTDQEKDKQEEELRKKIKAKRAEINNFFNNDIEEKRKLLKDEIKKPYEEFMELYNELLKKPYEEALKPANEKIANFDKKILDKKNAELLDYFNELCEKYQIDFLKFEQTNIKVNLSLTLTNGKKQIEDFLNGICEGLELIKQEEYKAEILIEFKKSLNATNAILTVKNRYKSIEEENKRIAAAEQKELELKQSATKVENVVGGIAPPKTKKEKIKEQEKKILKFSANATVDKLKLLIDFMKDNDIEFKQL